MERMIGTPMGAEIVVMDSPDHLGSGVLLELRMQSVFDHRRAEVFLDQPALSKLIVALEHHQDM